MASSLRLIISSTWLTQMLATNLVNVGHQVMMGSRTADSKPAQKWQSAAGKGTQIGTFADAAAFGELVLNCTNGANSIAALRQAAEANLRGKILIDIENPLDMSQKPPTLPICNTDSLDEQLE